VLLIVKDENYIVTRVLQQKLHVLSMQRFDSYICDFKKEGKSRVHDTESRANTQRSDEQVG